MLEGVLVLIKLGLGVEAGEHDTRVSTDAAGDSQGRAHATAHDGGLLNINEVGNSILSR